ncbi:16S rRNA (uracil(1498)-N(3))-methyltransferase [Vampirovibrio chlorellavorus]|uniref:16S rRNA (uracil(1498)-N(3))-methyltransferase n=1 Tax=Vampirovibrio chlorellavorus TaxID=758823 RepID=UPI0026EF83EF|nr:16S rRNA (uracil(1498)-N(3))-methyltransferase [Vampirovibrio chlorellavorus]
METFHLKRFFVSLPAPVAEFPATLTLEDESVAHHLRTVMRARVGESVVLVDGERRQAYVAVLRALERRALTVQVERRLPPSDGNLPAVTLAVALIKEQRWDWLIQKATELGVSVIQPIASERTIIKLDEKDFGKKQERWEAVMRSAAEQSEGLFIPAILPPVSVKTLCHQGSIQGQRILLAERGAHRETLQAILRKHPSAQTLLFAIGPEGGWTDAELAQFEQAGFVFAGLGQRIMRSETAAMAAMAAVVYELGG